MEVGTGRGRRGATTTTITVVNWINKYFYIKGI